MICNVQCRVTEKNQENSLLLRINAHKISVPVIRKQNVVKCIGNTHTHRYGHVGRVSSVIRSQWPSVLRRRSAVDRLLGLRFRIPPGAWMFALCVVSKRQKGKMKDSEDKETSTDEVKKTREYKKISRWGRDFLHPSRPVLGPTKPPIQWVPGLLSGVKRPGRGVKYPPHLELRLKK